MISKKLAALAALSLVTVSSTAVAQSAAPLSAVSTSAVRAGAEVEDAGEIRGGFLLPLAIIIAIIIGVLLLTGDDEDSGSP